MLEYIYFNITKQERDRIDHESAIRGRTRSKTLSTAIRIATSNYTNFSLADQLLEIPIPAPRYYQVYIRMSEEERSIIEHAASIRYRSPASLMYTIARSVTNGFTSFSIIDNGSDKNKEETYDH